MSRTWTEYELLLACYRSGQVSERQWQEHLRDRAFREWVEDQLPINYPSACSDKDNLGQEVVMPGRSQASGGRAMIGRPELILRPSTRYPSRPWALQLRVAGPAETSYAPIGHVSNNVACILADEGYAHFLFGDPRETCK